MHLDNDQSSDEGGRTDRFKIVARVWLEIHSHSELQTGVGDESLHEPKSERVGASHSIISFNRLKKSRGYGKDKQLRAVRPGYDFFLTNKITKGVRGINKYTL